MKQSLVEKAIGLMFEAKGLLDGGPGPFQSVSNELGDLLIEILMDEHGFEFTKQDVEDEQREAILP